MKTLFAVLLVAVSAASETPQPKPRLHLHWPQIAVAPTPPAGQIQCWEAERLDHSRHVMCGDSWGSLVDVSEALEQKHRELCKTIPNTNGVQICNGAAWYPNGQ